MPLSRVKKRGKKVDQKRRRKGGKTLGLEVRTEDLTSKLLFFPSSFDVFFLILDCN